jgi:hypothetical protein
MCGGSISSAGLGACSMIEPPRPLCGGMTAGHQVIKINLMKHYGKTAARWH